MLDKGFVVYENGLPIRMIGSLHDVTEMKQLENELVQEKMNVQKTVSETAIRVQEKERTRIGHELHDNVNQILSTTKLFVDMLNPGSEEEKQIKEKGVGYLLMAIDEIRKLSKELVTPSLQEIGLIKSIQQLVDDFCYTTKLNIRFTHDLETDLLDYGMQITLFRICQEQLKNIIVHSQASQVYILLQRKDMQVNLVIRDNGKGFNIKQASKGIGIANIHNRVKYYNGEVQLRSAPGEGCELDVKLPFDMKSTETAWLELG
jgi:signal transduction histidine kinase